MHGSDIKKAESLYKEYSIIGGMINEIIMSCLILKQKVQREKQLCVAEGLEPNATDGLTMEVTGKIKKYTKDLNKYHKRKQEIIQELNGFIKF